MNRHSLNGCHLYGNVDGLRVQAHPDGREQLHLQNADQKTQVGFIIKSTGNCQGFYQAHRQAHQFIEFARISECKLIVDKALLEKFFGSTALTISNVGWA
jgi:hypothetical protein